LSVVDRGDKARGRGAGSFPHPSGGLIPPNFRTTPPGFRGKGGREGKEREGERKGERRRERKGPPRVG